MWVRLISDGIQRNGLKITKKELKDVVKNFKHPVPLTIGHVLSDKAPAVGFIEQLDLRQDGLYGKYNLSPIGKILVASNSYKNLSVSLRRKPDGSWYLHHVALLGAAPPAGEDAEPIKIVEFSSSQEEESIDVEAAFADTPKYKSFSKTDYPICFECEWNKEAAMKKIVEKGGWKLLSECVGAVEIDEEGKLPESFSRYKFPYCDVVNGEVKIIAKAVSSALAYLNGARGAQIEPELEKVVRPVFERLMQRIQQEKQKKEMSKGGIDMEEVQKRLKALEKRLAEEKLNRLREIARKKFSEDVVKEIAEFASSLPMDFSQEETHIDKLIKILEKIPAPVQEGKMELSDSENDFDFSETVKAF